LFLVLLISTNVFIILLKSIYFETADDGIGDTNVPYGPGDYLPLVVDVEPPETSLAIEGPFVIKNSVAYIGNNSKLYLTATDKRSAIKSTYFSIDNKSWQQYEHAISSKDLPSNEHDLSFYSIDVSNNVEPIRKVKIFIDDLSLLFIL